MGSVAFLCSGGRLTSVFSKYLEQQVKKISKNRNKNQKPKTLIRHRSHKTEKSLAIFLTPTSALQRVYFSGGFKINHALYNIEYKSILSLLIKYMYVHAFLCNFSFFFSLFYFFGFRQYMSILFNSPKKVLIYPAPLTHVQCSSHILREMKAPTFKEGCEES